MRGLRAALTPSASVSGFEGEPIRAAIEALLEAPPRFPEDTEGAGRVVDELLAA